MSVAIEARVISNAWSELLVSFLHTVEHELLVASPWITEGTACLISRELAASGPMSIQVLARMDEADFLSGSSHLAAFRGGTYPRHHRVSFKALPMLHAKMLVADRKSVIVGSANLTEGGLCRNHEISLNVVSQEIGESCAVEFFRLWEIATTPPVDYLERIEKALADSLPRPDGGQNPRAMRSARVKVGDRGDQPGFKYTPPTGASTTRAALKAGLVAQTVRVEVEHEDMKVALDWLTRKLKFLSRAELHETGTVERLERLMYHPNTGVRATAVDHAGRTGNRKFLPRMHTLATNVSEAPEVRSASAFALGLLGAAESFSVLASLLGDGDDVERWARRGCFLLLNDVDPDDAAYLMRKLAIQEPSEVQSLAKSCAVHEGTLAERLTKALIVEQYAVGTWNEASIDQLAAIMSVTGAALRTGGKRVNLLAVAKSSSRALGVQGGDLRHGPLSPSLLKRLLEDNVTDPGLMSLFGASWGRVQESWREGRDVLAECGRFAEALGVLEEFLPE